MPRYIVITSHDVPDGVPPMTEWDPADVTAHMDHLNRINRELTESGELVEMTALAGLETATVVTAGGPAGTVITDGPFGETKEALAGFQIVDVESLDRAQAVAADVSAAPGPGGVPLRQYMEVRPVMFSWGESE